ncbi:MAG: hypothetical protein N2712_03460 [Brevinematales bacterium]|nr:hypothetical protein [Brevinematales bacterium]
MYKIVRNIDLTVEIGCGNFLNFIKYTLSSLQKDEAIQVTVKGYADKFTIVEWIKHIGHQIIQVDELNGNIYKIIIR